MSKAEDQRIAELRWSLAFVGKAALNNLIVGEDARKWLLLDSCDASQMNDPDWKIV